jgi:hypothetical protein
MTVPSPRKANSKGAHHDGAAHVASSLEGLRSIGWPVQREDNHIVLCATSGFCAVLVPEGRSARVLALLQSVDAEGPVIGVRSPDPAYVFVAEADAVIEGETFTDVGATLVRAPQTVLLPSPAVDRSRWWVVAPHPTRHRWLPSVSTVLWALRRAGDDG